MSYTDMVLCVGLMIGSRDVFPFQVTDSTAKTMESINSKVMDFLQPNPGKHFVVFRFKVQFIHVELGISNYLPAGVELLFSGIYFSQRRTALFRNQYYAGIEPCEYHSAASKSGRD